MNRPKVLKGDWIKIGAPGMTGGIDGYVLEIYSDGTLGVGYYQNSIKAIKAEVFWSGEYWDFVSPDCDGIYLRGEEEAIVKRGPLR